MLALTHRLRWRLQSCSPKHGWILSPDSKHRKGHPCSGPASSSKAAAVSTGKRFEPNQNKTSTPRNVPAGAFVKVWCLSRGGLEEEVAGDAVSPNSFGLLLANQPLWLSLHKAAVPGTRSAEPSPGPESWVLGAPSSHPTTRPSQGARGAGHATEAPPPAPGSFVGAPCARSGTTVGSRCARWQRRHRERGVGTPLTLDKQLQRH